MDRLTHRSRTRFHSAPALGIALGALSLGPAAWGQSQGWQRCVELGATQRLACFDAWAAESRPPAPTSAGAPLPAGAPVPTPAAPQPAPWTGLATAPAARPGEEAVDSGDCRNSRSTVLSRFWELDTESDCDVFTIRGYRPLSLSVIGSNTVNKSPTSPTPGHTASPQPYQTTETKIQLSVRTKIAQGLLPRRTSDALDSLWFGYTQQSYWQLFNGTISRPFRDTNHEPELIYIYPLSDPLPAGWKWRYVGLGVVHQSNGQSLPLSRSWNRAYVMTGLEHDTRHQLFAKLWQRQPEPASSDDNPDISDYVGRAEFGASWQVNADHTLLATVKHSLTATARGSTRLEWLRTLRPSGSAQGLRFHVQLFSGYGDSLVDYNRRRNVLSVGLSLVDW